MTEQERLRRVQLLQLQARAKANFSAAPAPQSTVSSVAGNAGAGTQRGIANMLGFPVDAVTGAINGVGQLTGGWDPIQNPAGGSESIYQALAPFREGVAEPQTQAERIARRVGEEVGAGAVTAPVAVANAGARAIPALATELAGSIGAGGGAAIANEVAPGSVVAEVAGALAVGIPASMAAGRIAGVNGTDPVVRRGIDEQRAIANNAYNGTVRQYTDTVTQPDVEGLTTNLSQRLFMSEGLDPTLHPNANAVMQRMVADSDTPRTIEEMERLRRFAQRNVAGSANPEERRIGQIMVREITDYIDNLSPSQMSGGTDPSAATSALVEGRMASRRANAAQTVEDVTTRARRRAARTGSGGNEINATRQNISALLDNPNRSRGFTPAERQAMEEIVMGTPAGNAARSLSRFAPTSGGLAAMLNLGGAVAAPQFALPLVALTEGAKMYGDRSIRRSADSLVDMLAPDRILQTGDQELRGLLSALLAGRIGANAGE